MAGYTRQRTIADGNTIAADLFNGEYNQIVNAFDVNNGHKHDGTASEGPVIGLIGDANLATPLNKIIVDTKKGIDYYLDLIQRFDYTILLDRKDILQQAESYYILRHINKGKVNAQWNDEIIDRQGIRKTEEYKSLPPLMPLKKPKLSKRVSG